MKNYVQRTYCLTTVLLLRKPHHFYRFAFVRYNIDFSGYNTVQGQLQSHQGKNNNIYVLTKKYSCQNSAKIVHQFLWQVIDNNRCHKNGSAHHSLINILLKHRFCEKLSPKKSHVSKMKFAQWKVRNTFLFLRAYLL